MSCPNASNVSIVSLPEGVCFPVEGCPDGPPVEVARRPDATGSAAITAPGLDIPIDVTGRQSLTAIFQTDGSWNGLVQAILSFDGGANYTVQTTIYAFDQGFGSGVRDLAVCRFPGTAFFLSLDVTSCDFVKLVITNSAGSALIDWRASDNGPPYADVTRSAVLTGDLNTYAITRGMLGWNTANRQWQPPGVFQQTIASPFLSGNDVGIATDTRLWMLSDGGGTTQLSTPSTYVSAQANAAGSTALWTPPLGTKFRLQRYMLSVTGNASTAGGAVITISLLDGAGAIGQDHDVFCPGAALAAGALYTTGWIDLGNGVKSSATNNVLNINLSAALTAGFVRVLACGTLEV